MIGEGFRWLWSYMEEFGQNLVLLFYKIMDKITPGDKFKDLAEEQENKILATKKERDNLEKSRQSDTQQFRSVQGGPINNFHEIKYVNTREYKNNDINTASYTPMARTLAIPKEQV